MTLKEQLRQNIFPNFVNAGIFKNQDRVKFQIQNGNDLDFQCYIKGCGCLGRIIRTARTLDFDIEAKYEDTGSVVIYKSGDQLLQKKNVGGIDKFFDLKSGSLVNGIIPDELPEIKAYKFDRTMPIYFDDGQEFKNIDADGMLTDNPEKASANVQIIFWTLKD